MGQSVRWSRIHSAPPSNPREVDMHSLPLSPQRLPLRRRPLFPIGPRLSGVALFGGLLLGLPLNPQTMGQMQALNRELGKLCNSPPRQALNVCRIHARLVDAL